MNTFEAYQLYLALKLHFTTENYDIRKTKGKVKASLHALEKKPKVQYQLQKFVKKYNKEEYINYLVANFINGDKWGGMYSDGSKAYLDWQKTHDSLTYTYQQDIHELSLQVANVQDLWSCEHGHPLLLKAYYGKTCNLETLVILNKLYKFIHIVDEQLVLDPIWNTLSLLIYKYSPFVKIDKEKFTLITQGVLNEAS